MDRVSFCGPWGDNMAFHAQRIRLSLIKPILHQQCLHWIITAQHTIGRHTFLEVAAWAWVLRGNSSLSLSKIGSE